MTTKLREYASNPAGLDWKPGLVKGCKILGWESKNGRRYRREAGRRARGLYERKDVYLNHADPGDRKPRRVEDKFGWFENVTDREDGLYGDFGYNTGHPFAPAFEGWLRNNPSAIGFSHAADGDVRRGTDGIDEVCEITAVDSIDLVANPATTKGLFESTGNMEPNMDAPLPEPGAEGYASQVGALVAAIVADAALDTKAKGKKILAALKLLDDAPAPAAVTDEVQEAIAAKVAAKLAESLTAKLTESLTPTLAAVTALTEGLAKAGQAAKLNESKTPTSLPPAKPEPPHKLTVEALVAAIGA